MKKITLGLLIAICFVQNNYSQTTTQSEIIISEENLISLINTIKQKRDSLYFISQRNNEVVENQKTKTNLIPNIYESSDNTDYDLVMSRMSFLESKLDYLTLLMQKQNTTKTSTAQKYVPSQSVYSNTTKPQNNGSSNTYLLNRIKDLEKELTEVKKSQNNSKKLADVPTKTTVAEIPKTSLSNNPIIPTTVTNNYITQASEQKSIRDTIVIEKRELSDYDELVKKYSTSSHNILFENNSAEINSSYYDSLDQLVLLCNSNSKIDLFLKGFASKKGSVAYNQKLSMLRTENVKKYLINKGIHPSRILSQYHGVDYASTSEENARRVTISYVIRR